MKIVYIAAPYGAPTPEERNRNVERARHLARYAVSVGLAPVLVHGEILAGTYGNDADPKKRERGQDCTVAIALLVCCAYGLMWVLERDDGTLSPGTYAEVAAWRGTSEQMPYSLAEKPIRLNWAGWVKKMSPPEIPDDVRLG